MSDKKKQEGETLEENSQRTLVTLDQLSQTIEVMSSVVNRLRAHLSEQVAAAIKPAASQSQPLCTSATGGTSSTSDDHTATESSSSAQNPLQRDSSRSTTLTNPSEYDGAEKPGYQKSLVVELSSDAEVTRDPRATLH